MKVVLITERDYHPSALPWDRDGNPPIRLAEAPVKWGALEDEAAWQPFAAQARTALELGRGLLREPSPIAVRLAIGMLALGARPPEVQGLLEDRDDVLALARALAGRLGGALRQRASGVSKDSVGPHSHRIWQINPKP